MHSSHISQPTWCGIGSKNYGPGRAASRATDLKRALSLSVRFSPGGDQGFDQRFSDFKTDIKGAQEEAAAKAAKRVRHEKPYDYKKAHEEQATFNAKVQDAEGGHRCTQRYGGFSRDPTGQDRGGRGYISISWRNSSKSPTAPRTGGAWWQSTLQTSWRSGWRRPKRRRRERRG